MNNIGFDKLKQDNEKLKKENKELNKLIEELGKIIQCKTGTIVVLKTENERLKSELKSQQMINLKQQDIAQDYWNALEEIWEMAKEIDDVDKWIEQNLMPTQVCERIEKINNKINEVLK